MGGRRTGVATVIRSVDIRLLPAGRELSWEFISPGPDPEQYVIPIASVLLPRKLLT